MTPDALARFSTSTGCFSTSASFELNTRARMSVVPPCAAGVSSLIGRFGHSCASAATEAATAAAASRLRTVFIFSPLLCLIAELLHGRLDHRHPRRLRLAHRGLDQQRRDAEAPAGIELDVHALAGPDAKIDEIGSDRGRHRVAARRDVLEEHAA